jgi:hypothetical protein
VTASEPPDVARLLDGLDREVLAHLARMPEAHRQLLDPLVRADAADGWLRNALLAYLRHFVRAFDRGEDRAGSEASLVDELCALAGVRRGGDVDEDLESAETELARGFVQRGYRFLGGRTPPHVGPYVWSHTVTRTFTVALPRDEPQHVDVHFMHDFVLRGWLYWQTFGEHGAGGWYKDGEPEWPDGLYCVADRYPEPFENRSFQVSLLGHEAQHVADHRAHPGLSSAELEYRAKLVELIGYESVEERLAFFLSDASDDPEQPHPYAAHQIVTRLSERLFGGHVDETAWDAIDYAEVRRHADALLDEDTVRLTRR